MRPPLLSLRDMVKQHGVALASPLAYLVQGVVRCICSRAEVDFHINFSYTHIFPVPDVATASPRSHAVPDFY